MKYVTLNNGIQMPVLGYGVYQINDFDECEKCVLQAIEAGYRLIDTAQAYGNEKAVGSALSKCAVPREELFITTKISVANSNYEKAKASIEQSLLNLQTDYIDLMLIHQPFHDYYGSYRAMEEAVEEGKIRAIGVSNFYADRFIDLAHFVKIKPAVNQMETHIFNQQKELSEILKETNTQLEAWAPFAEGRTNFFDHEVLLNIGKKYHKTVAQIALRFMIQKNIVVIPKSVHLERMKENIDVFDFELEDEEMKVIEALDEKTSRFRDHRDPETVKMHIKNC